MPRNLGESSELCSQWIRICLASIGGLSGSRVVAPDFDAISGLLTSGNLNNYVSIYEMRILGH